ncbi:MAG: insulinase family protein, partial [Gemmatimonadaceae bacterium]
EHMAFNGTEHFAKNELVSFIEKVGMRFGADLNASTAFDETVYMLTLPTDSAATFARGFEILRDWAHGITFDTTEVTKERGVVIEEWRLGRGAGARIQDKQWPVAFHGSQYAVRLPIGEKRVIETAKRDNLKRFYDAWYRPDLMAVVAVGDFDPKQVETMIRERFRDFAGAKVEQKREAFAVPDNDTALVAIATDKEETQSSVSVVFKHAVRPQGTVGAFRYSAIAELYNGMLNARFHELTQQAAPPFINAGSSHGRIVRALDGYVLGALVKDGGIPRGLDALLTEAERVDRFGFTATELERQKKDLLRGYERAFAERDKTNSGAFAGEYVQSFLQSEPLPGIGYEYKLMQQMLPAITLAEVNKLASEWISEKNRIILVSAPDKAGVPVPTRKELLAVFAATKKKAIVAYKDIVGDSPLVAHAPAPGVVTAESKIPELGVTQWTLANGVRVILKPTDFKADEILVSAYAPGGTSLVPDKDAPFAGIGTFMASAGGLGAFGPVELQKVLAGKALRVPQPSLGDLYATLGGRASPRDLETFLQLVYLDFTAIRKDTVVFQSLKSRFRDQLVNRGSDPQQVYEDTLNAILSQHNPRERSLSAAMVDSVALEPWLAFLRQRLSDASNFTFVIVGNFSTDSVKPLVERYIGGLPAAGKKEMWRDAGVRPPIGVVKTVVKKGVEPKASTRIIFSGPFEYSPINRYAINALADVMTIRLRDRLREELGGTYGVDVGASPSQNPRGEYFFTIDFGSAPDRVDALTKAVFTFIDSLKATGPTADDIAKVKETQRREHETQLKQNGYWVSALVAKSMSGEDPRTLLDLEKRIAGLTPAIVRDAANKYLRTDNFVQASLVPERVKK